jgi:hypothetical protein
MMKEIPPSSEGSVDVKKVPDISDNQQVPPAASPAFRKIILPKGTTTGFT